MPIAQAAAPDAVTSTPIKHLVMIFQENLSFDHYFATSPNAENSAGDPGFTGLAGMPTVNGLDETMLSKNPNRANPFRLGRDEAVTCHQDYHYDGEQRSFRPVRPSPVS